MQKININNNNLRIFGLIWFCIFLFIGIHPLFKGLDIRNWSIALSIFFLSIAIIKPEFLKNFYKIWVRFGDYIGNLISKFILLILFCFLFTPISLILKLLNKDLLNKKIMPNSKTYWIRRKDQPQSMKNQF